MTGPIQTPPIGTSGIALVVVDMQNGFCHPEGSFGRAGADVTGCANAIPANVELIAAAHEAEVPVFFTRAVHEPDFADWNMLAELPMYAGLRDGGSCEEGTWDAEFVSELDVRPGDRIVTKSRFSPFVETDIERQLHDLGVTTIVVTGVGTSACVESTVRDSSQRSFRTIVAREATGDIAQSAHDQSLHIMGSLFGWVMDTESIVRAWKKK